MMKKHRPGFLPAARKVLSRSKGPLTCHEIIDRAKRAGLLTTTGKTPAKTLYSSLTRMISTQGHASGFKKVGPGQFDLVDR